MNILLIGNPNVGKSAIFSHLTGINVITSNYPGTTVEYLKGYLTYKNKKHTVIDVPGTYRLDPESEAERVAAEMIGSGDILVNVVDATNLERNLNLTLQLMEYGKPMVLVLNMWDDAKHKGIEIDKARLEKLLGISVITTNGVTGEGVSILPEKCMNAKKANQLKLTSDERWKRIGQITREVQNLSHRHHTFIERIQDITIHPVFSIPVALAVLYLAVRFIILLGEFFTGLAGKLFEAVYLPFILWLSKLLGGEGILHSLLIGEISKDAVNFEGAMGVLTTGAFVAFGIVLPYIVLFYIVFGFLEDLGYLPRVAVILDKLLHRIGLHGYSVIPMLLACGCNVPGILAIRNLETRRERFITAVVTSITIPCMAQTALIMKAVGKRGSIFIVLTFMTLVTVWVILGMTLRLTVKGSTPTLLLEIPPYRVPSIKIQLKKLKMRISCFFREAIPYVLGGIFLINLLHATGVIKWIGKLFSPLIKGIFGLPDETVVALIIGIVRKDAAVALLEPIGLNDYQVVTAVVILTLYFPCVATFGILLRELGIKDTAMAVGIMLAVTLTTGGGLNLLGKIYSPVILVFVELAVIAIASIIFSSLSGAKKEEV